MRRVIRLFLIAVLCAAALGGTWYYVAAPNQGKAAKPVAEKDRGHGKEGGDEGSVEMSDAKVAAAGIELLQAGPGDLRESLRLNGIIQANQETLIQVTPRFPGVVREMRKRLGDKVVQGEVLAKVESNQSLTIYELKAPIAGTVIDRQSALGEYAGEQKALYTVADLSTVWIDFSVYRLDFSRVHIGQTIIIDPEDGGPPINAKIDYVSPIGSSDTQSATARATVPNNDRVRPGLFVTGRLLLSAKPVDIAIKLNAVQMLDGRTVVFVRNGNKFEARDVELGARDEEQVEVMFGLVAGDTYAAKNSFVVKAELAKGSASHEH
jgi:cobalt-zinc-cadmium efflux system membrane fusion protein